MIFFCHKSNRRGWNWDILMTNHVLRFLTDVSLVYSYCAWCAGKMISLIPANCTDKFQPLDVSINKEFLHGWFHEWYASEVSKQLLQSSEEVKLVDLRDKPLAATWIIQLMDYLKIHPEWILSSCTIVTKI